jgi:hypothetical protein
MLAERAVDVMSADDDIRRQLAESRVAPDPDGDP